MKIDRRSLVLGGGATIASTALVGGVEAMALPAPVPAKPRILVVSPLTMEEYVASIPDAVRKEHARRLRQWEEADRAAGSLSR